MLKCTVDCGAPGAPQRGSLESYTDTTEGSELFYSCNQHLVPEGRMRAVCSRNGWSPNPADLSCSIGMLYSLKLWCQSSSPVQWIETPCVYIRVSTLHTHTLVWVGWIAEASEASTLGSWVTHPLSVCHCPIPETKHQTPCKPCTKQDMCMKPNVIPLTPQGHLVPQLYHRTAWGMSSLKTSSSSQMRLHIVEISMG